MRVLMLSSRIPYPLTAGFRIRIFNEAKYFKKNGHIVDLLYLGTKVEYEKYSNELGTVYDSVFFVPLRKIEVLKNIFFAVFSGKPFQVALYQNEEFQRILFNIKNNYDVIIGNHIRTAEYLKMINPRKTILDLHDAISYNYAKLIGIEKGIKKIIYKIELNRVLKYEREIISIFPKVVIVSAKDKEWLNSNGIETSNITVIPVAVRDDIKNKKNDYSNDENAICFLGKMSYQPNEDAVLWFVNNVMPELVKRYSDMVFYILGVEPTKTVLSLAKNSKNVCVTGYIENPYEIMSKVKATVVPIRNGAGVQNKVLESMFVGTPVVASKIAAEGIGAINNEHIIVAKTKEEFLESLCKVIESEEYRKRIGVSGQEFIEDNYTWKSLWKKWNEIIDEVKQEA